MNMTKVWLNEMLILPNVTMEPSNVRKTKWTTKCDKSIVTCDVNTAQCDDGIIRALAFGGVNTPQLLFYNPRQQKPTSSRFVYSILHPQTLLYLFYQLILQLTLHPSFYFYIQPNKII